MKRRSQVPLLEQKDVITKEKQTKLCVKMNITALYPMFADVLREQKLTLPRDSNLGKLDVDVIGFIEPFLSSANDTPYFPGESCEFGPLCMRPPESEHSAHAVRRLLSFSDRSFGFCDHCITNPLEPKPRNALLLDLLEPYLYESLVLVAVQKIYQYRSEARERGCGFPYFYQKCFGSPAPSIESPEFKKNAVQIISRILTDFGVSHELLDLCLPSYISVDDEEYEEKDEVSKCSVCLDDIGRRNKCVLHCGHSFHLSCIVNWIMRGTGMNVETCPECRRSIVDKPQLEISQDENLVEIVHLDSSFEEIRRGTPPPLFPLYP